MSVMNAAWIEHRLPALFHLTSEKLSSTLKPISDDYFCVLVLLLLLLLFFNGFTRIDFALHLMSWHCKNLIEIFRFRYHCTAIRNSSWTVDWAGNVAINLHREGEWPYRHIPVATFAVAILITLYYFFPVLSYIF